MSQWLKEGQCGWDLVGENESIVEKGLEKQEVGHSRWDIVNHERNLYLILLLIGSHWRTMCRRMIASLH